MVCSFDDEMKLIARQHPDGFASHLLKGTAPAWLKPVDLAGIVKIWRVVDLAADAGIDPVITGSNAPRPAATLPPMLMPRLSDLRGSL